MGWEDTPPDYSTISAPGGRSTWELIRVVFGWVLELLAEKKPLKGKTVGIDGTMLETNAAMRPESRAK